jgi:elongation factor G
LALAFKVVHMKGRGGSGDGRVVFARVYSGQIQDRDQLQIISPPAPGEAAEKPRTERVGGMLELAGGRFDNLVNGVCKSGDVCALVGLRTVVTGDTIILQPKTKKKDATVEPVCLAGVASPKPVLTVRLEAETTEQQKRLSEALSLLVIEDPSLVVEESESATLISGLGELHIEVTLDRLSREYGLQVITGKPAVAYRESLVERVETPGGLLNYDRTIGNTRLQAAIHLVLEPKAACESSDSPCILLSDPTVSLGPQARAFLGIFEEGEEEDESDMLATEEAVQMSELARTLVLGCKGALRRGAIGSYALANIHCHVVNIDSEGGLSGVQAMPGALRAAAAHAISQVLHENKERACVLMEPSMSVEVIVPSDMVGIVLSDLTGRRGTVGDVIIGEGDQVQAKALVRGEVPLVEILGYANSLRSLTGGEGAFTAEYKGHSPCDVSFVV